MPQLLSAPSLRGNAASTCGIGRCCAMGAVLPAASTSDSAASSSSPSCIYKYIRNGHIRGYTWKCPSCTFRGGMKTAHYSPLVYRSGFGSGFYLAPALASVIRLPSLWAACGGLDERRLTFATSAALKTRRAQSASPRGSVGHGTWLELGLGLGLGLRLGKGQG